MIVDIALPWLLGALVGSMLFFAATVAPTVFRVLSAENGGAFLRRFFPQYYLWGMVLAILCTLVALMKGNPVVISLCAAVAVLFIYARQLLMPRINRTRATATSKAMRRPAGNSNDCTCRALSSTACSFCC